MARQRIHNRRAGHGSGSGPSWISYSDMMAALVLIFVLFIVFNLYQYNTTLQLKTQELADQQALLDEQEGLIIIQQAQLDTAQGQLLIAQNDLAIAQAALDAQIILVGQQQAEMVLLQAQLDADRIALASATDLLQQQRIAFQSQTAQLTGIVGVRTEIIQKLSRSLSANNINAVIDPKTGAITLESTVFFETGSYTIKPEGQLLLDVFIPVYLDVLLDPQYSEYLGQIIIEGHTDSSGSYISNLQLSQNRALAVAKYCLAMPSLNGPQRQLLMRILTATGRSSADLVYNEDGTENKEASRRVEFKFTLRDADMIEQMQTIMSSWSSEGGE